MLNEIMPELKKEQLNETTLDVNNIRQILENPLAANSLEDEIAEFFREVAALKGQSVHDTLREMITGTQKYLEAVDTPIEFKNGIPTDINKFSDKLEKLSVGIEACWDVFSQDSRHSFINLAQEFCEASFKFQGWKGLLIRLQLLFPSIRQRKNLFRKYKDSFLLIPKAVNRAIELRESKRTAQLQTTAQSLLERARVINQKQQALLPFLKHLGRTPEEQLEKNQAAMAWAKARMEEIERKRNRRNS
ncbi:MULTISPECIES: hypothetical protein [unclassified Coleofasciculus]|uniref:hypothetical protein n=1 Tax=unclassified Coleofasciculus TaxID=2692782 RepID=UPI0018811C24|nr:MULTISPECIES: hypothetical protein [unclassified Coleofasciculus]MBE9129736.1 hypothetical protein [Coleofasciculus sp. LEGE 07081]MBE9151149.1 hypothetical protein [Coleofasciculus sp. LEGE 07092]